MTQKEQDLLDSICRAYYLPAWCSESDYVGLFKQAGLQGVRTADWSEEVAPFWSAVIRSALTAQGIGGLFKAGWSTLRVRFSLFTLVFVVLLLRVCLRLLI